MGQRLGIEQDGVRWLRIAAGPRYATSRQRKIYLCNWFVKIVKPGKEQPNDQVQCHVPMKMTKFDIRNYFWKIYGVRVAKVNTRIQLGKEKRVMPVNIRKKKPDVKVAYLTLMDQTFEFPDLFSKYDRKNR